MHFAIIDTSTNKVINIVMYDATPSNPPPGFPGTHIAVNYDGRTDLWGDWKNWIWDGVNLTALPQPPVVVPIPKVVSSMQAKVALSRAGLLAQVQTWVNSQDAETQLIWNSAIVFQRNSQLIANAAAALGLSSATVDQLFVTAAAINP